MDVQWVGNVVQSVLLQQCLKPCNLYSSSFSFSSGCQFFLAAPLTWATILFTYGDRSVHHSWPWPGLYRAKGMTLIASVMLDDTKLSKSWACIMFTFIALARIQNCHKGHNSHCIFIFKNIK